MATIDVHCHPALNSWLFKTKFQTDHWTISKDFFPCCMTVDYPKMLRGEVDTILSSVYLPESPLIDEADPTGKVQKVLDFILKCRDKRESNDYPNQPFDQTMKILDYFEQVIDSARREECNVQIARNFQELKSLMANGTKTVLHSIEGGHSLGRKIDGNAPSYIENVDALFDKGVSLLTLAHFYENDIVAPVVGMPPSFMKKLKLSDERDLNKGLTPVGEEVVSHMFDIGMIVDVTHCTPKARDKVFEINDQRGDKRRPIVFSHVGIADMFDHPMNPTPDEIRKTKECGGVIGVIFDNYWLMGEEEKASFLIFDFKKDPGINFVLDTTRKIHAITGTFDTISIGSDLDGFTDPPDDLYNIARFKFLKEKLIERYGENPAKKILGDNMLRVLEKGWGNNT